MPAGIRHDRPASPSGVSSEISSTSPQAPAVATATPSPGASAPVAGERSADATRILGTTNAAVSTDAVLQTFFAPYEDTRHVELQLLDEIIAARKADPKTYPEGANPYRIDYAVYNISSQAVLQKLVDADRAGIDVQVLIEDHQLDPQKDWNTGDDFLRDNGFSFAADHNKLTSSERKTTNLIGIKRDTLMHLKSRLISYPDPATGEVTKKLLTGSMNPGQSAVNNDENLTLITDQQVIERYSAMLEATRDNGTIKNSFDPDAAINVMFTGAAVKGGPRVTDQIFKMIDQEQEAIFLSVFTLRNLTTPGQRASLVDKLKAAKARGVEVVVVTDRKQADGVDASGNRISYDDRTDDWLQDGGIPVYKALNEAGPHNAMHAKSAIFGLTNMKVITDTGNWTKAALGNKNNNTAQNEESYLFLDSQKLDDNATGMRYLGNFLHLLRKYGEQNPEQPEASTLINRLAEHPAWPRVNVDFSVMAHTFHGQDVYITGDHPSLGNWTKEGPGLKLNTKAGTYPMWESGGSLELPFGTQFSYKVVKRSPDGSLDWEPGDNAFLIVDPTDRRQGTQKTATGLVRDDQFGE